MSDRLSYNAKNDYIADVFNYRQKADDIDIHVWGSIFSKHPREYEAFIKVSVNGIMCAPIYNQTFAIEAEAITTLIKKGIRLRHAMPFLTINPKAKSV